MADIGVAIIAPDVIFQRTLQYQACAYCPPPPPAVVAQTYALANVSTSQVFPKNLYYQARIEPVPLAPRNLTTTLEWMQHWKGPPRYQPVKTYYQPWLPREPVAAPTAVTAYSTFDVQTSYLARRSFQYQDTVYAFPPPPAVAFTAFSVFSVETVQVSRRSLFYESTFAAPYPYEAEPADAGPADEHERIACVPLASRVALVPALSRVVDVPLSDREQDSNEYRDRSCGTPETPVATEPEVPTEESPFQEDAFQHEDDAFQ